MAGYPFEEGLFWNKLAHSVKEFSNETVGINLGVFHRSWWGYRS